MTPWVPASLVNHLWQSTLFVGVVWLAAIALRHNGARVRYWLWVAASAKFLVPFAWLVSLGAQFEWRTAPAIAQPAVSFVIEEVFAPSVFDVAVPATAAQQTPFLQWLFLGIWLAGSAAVLLSWWRQWLPVRSALREGSPIQLGQQYDTGGLRVLSSPSMFEPAVVGIWRPVLVLPRGLIDRLTAGQVNALIAHERCHVRCHDNLVAATHMAVEAVFWFHPLVWWIEPRMIDERERACDEAVLRSGSEPSDYAESILEVCRNSVAAPLACMAGISGSNLRDRIESIMRRQNGRPMTAGRKLALACAAVVAVVGPAAAGAVGGAASSAGTLAQLLPAFDAISIRQNRSGDSAGGGRITPDGGLLFRNSPIKELIVDAYSTQDGRVRGGPGWISADKYDIDARTAGPVAIEETRLMLQSLLVDRFKLRTHWQTEELFGYALVVARGGPRLTLNADPKCGGACGVTQSITGELTARKLPLSELAPRLERILGRPVVDRTGVSGDFDFTLRWAPDTTQFGGRGQELANDQRPSLIAALEEQVGLKLEATKVPVQFLVIDAIERPSEN